jgi:hypothetical protein
VLTVSGAVCGFRRSAVLAAGGCSRKGCGARRDVSCWPGCWCQEGGPPPGGGRKPRLILNSRAWYARPLPTTGSPVARAEVHHAGETPCTHPTRFIDHSAGPGYGASGAWPTRFAR